MKITAVDPRDERWDDQAPSYRVYFWTGDGTSDEHRVSGVDAPEVLSWADRTARATRRTYSVMTEVRNDALGLGLVRLAGWDPKTNHVSSSATRPEYAHSRPDRDAGLIALPGGSLSNGAHVLDDRVFIFLVVRGDDGWAATFEWQVVDDLGTHYEFAGGGSGGGHDGVAYGGVGFTPRPPAEASRLYVGRPGDPVRAELPLL